MDLSADHTRQLILAKIQQAGDKGCTSQELVESIHQWEEEHAGVREDIDGVPDTTIEEVQAVLRELESANLITIDGQNRAHLIQPE